MINKQFILGTVLGIFIGVSSSSFASMELMNIEMMLSNIEMTLSYMRGDYSTLTTSDLMVYCSN